MSFHFISIVEKRGCQYYMYCKVLGGYVIWATRNDNRIYNSLPVWRGYMYKSLISLDTIL